MILCSVGVSPWCISMVYPVEQGECTNLPPLWLFGSPAQRSLWHSCTFCTARLWVASSLPSDVSEVTIHTDETYSILDLTKPANFSANM